MNPVSLAAGIFRHLRFGPATVRDFLNNTRLEWSLSSVAPNDAGTSLSDNQSYGAIVELASKERWSDFRSNKEYMDVLEHVSFQLGSKYLRELRGWKRLPEMLESKLSTDFARIGKPPIWRFSFQGHTKVLNPTYLRYLHVAKLVNEQFGDISSLKVCEIGVGFGGQAAVFSNALRPKQIALFDLPHVLILAKRFLNETCPQGSFDFHDGRDPKKIKADLVVSNYAFSELQRSIQLQYLDRFVSNSPRGFMMWNRLSEHELGGLSIAEFLKFIPNAVVVDEWPRSFRGNVLITWGSNAGKAAGVT